jgi:uncharacterized protein (TIGR03118 family)
MRHASGNLWRRFQAAAPARRRCERRPALEALEERAMLSAAPHSDPHDVAQALPKKPKPVPTYQQTILVSDDSAQNPQVVDTDLSNPWGIAFSPTGPFWICENLLDQAGIFTVSATGTVTPSAQTVGVAPGSPTGQVFNTTASTSSPSFLIPTSHGTHVPALFLFDTLFGTIDGWAPGSTGKYFDAFVVASSPSASYTGLALGSNGSQSYLYAANDGSKAGIDVYNSSFTKVTLAGTFVDPKLKKGFGKKFVPYNIQNIGGQLYVMYRGSNFKGGAVAVFNTNGKFVRQISANNPSGHLQAPWGVALAPANFGGFSNDLLVGNFGNGRINAFNPKSGKFLGQLSGTNKKPIVNSDLWALQFGNGGSAGSQSTLYFDAGINNQLDGLFGSLRPA